MDWLSSIGAIAQGLFVTLTAIISFVVWKRVGFKAPRYIHVIAVIGGCIGAMLAYMGHVSGAEHGDRALWLVIAFPIGTYFFFGFFGGGIVMANRDADDHRDPRA